MKQIKIVLIVFLVPFLAFSQKTMKNTIKFKNGNELRGEVLEKDAKKLKLKMYDGSILVYNLSEIDTVLVNKVKANNSKFYNRTSFGLLAGNQSSFTISAVNGYNFNQKWALGLGVGTEKYGDYYYWYNGARHLSIYGDLQYSFKNSQSTPYLAFDAGFSSPLRINNTSKKGFFLGLEFGVLHYSNPDFGITTSLGYRFSYLQGKHRYYEDYYTIDYVNQIQIKFGVIFK